MTTDTPQDIIDKLFSESLDVSEELRESWLDNACVGLPASIRLEVEALLKADHDAELLATTPEAVAAANIAKMLPATFMHEQMVGKQVGSFEITDVVGGGGFGTVYAAKRIDQFEQKVAIKFIRHDLADRADVLRRFELERHVVASLEHDSIARMLDGGCTEDGRPYFVMEFIEGKSITAYCDEKYMSIRDRLHLFMKVCDAVSLVHQYGIIHRDVKPDNILVTPMGIPKLVDFGIAKIRDSETLFHDTRITVSGQAPMTLYYASPEQVRGEQVGVSSDVYSLGIVLFELLSGCSPYSPQSGMHQDVSHVILNQAPSRPSDVFTQTTVRPSRNSEEEIPVKELAGQRSSTPARLKHALRGDLDTIALMAVRKDPDRRYASTKELSNDIQRYFDRLPVFARRDSPVYVIATYARRNRAITSLVSALAVTLLAGLIGVGWQRSNFLVERHNREMITADRDKDRIARETSLPIIRQLQDDSNYLDAFAVAEVAREQIPSDPELLALIDQVSAAINITSEPVGASVELRPANHLTRGWTRVGITPLRDKRIAKGFYHFRIRKNGFDDLLLLHRVRKPESITFDFQEPGLHPDMVHVAESAGYDIPAFGFKVKEFKEYFIDKHEVTNQQYQAFVSSGGYENPRFWSDRLGENWAEVVSEFRDIDGFPGPKSWKAGKFPINKGSHPVRGVSWYEAAAYSKFVEKDLPTIYHWYGASGTYNQESAIVPTSNINGKNNAPAAVGRYQGVGPVGAFDMAGNVREWCSTGTDDGQRFILGGSWRDPLFMFSEPAVRSPTDRDEDFGFRCVKDVQPLNSEFHNNVSLSRRDYLIGAPPCSDQELKQHLALYSYDRSDLSATLVKSESVNGGLYQEIKIDTAYDSEQFTAHLFLPDPTKFKPPYQAIVHFPGSYAISSDDEALWFADPIVKTGRAALLPVYWGTYGRRSEEFKNGYPNITSNYMGAIIKIAKDFSRSVDYLSSREDIDSGRLGYYGYSWGAMLSPILLATDGRIKAAVLHCGGFPPHLSHGSVDPVNFMPRIQSPVLMANGKYDAIFPVVTSQVPMFNRFPESNPKLHLIDDSGGHWYPKIDDEMESWFDLHLGIPVTVSQQ